MKRMVILGLCVVRGLAVMPANAEEFDHREIAGSSAFAVPVEGLYPTGEALLARSGAEWRISNRTEDWQSAEFNAGFAAKEGARIKFSAKLREHDSDVGEFRLSLKIVDSSGTHYENVAAGSASRGQWCSLNGEYALPKTITALYPFLERGDSLGDYEIADVRFGYDGSDERHPPDLSLAPLKESFHLLGMTCGAGVGDAVSSDPSGDQKRLLVHHFDVLSPENQLKAKFLLRRDGTVDFAAVRPWMDFAKTNGMRVAAQALVWSQLTPEWFFHEEYDSKRPLASSATMKQRLSDYIAAVLEGIEREWPGIVSSWVVVNEAVAGDGSPRLEENLFLKTIGPDYIAFAFECAARHRPKNCRFLYGDSNLEGYPAKIDYVLSMLKREQLISRHLVDGIGLQCHLKIDWPSMNDLRSCCGKIAAAGLCAEVNELDVQCPAASAGQPLADRYREIFDTLLAARKDGLRLDHVTWWGLTDAYSWMTSFYNLETRPLIFDADNRAKPCFKSVVDALAAPF